MKRMQYIPVRYVDQAEVAAAVDRAVLKMGSDVVRVRYVISKDTIGEPALYFRIVLSDEASQRSRLSPVRNRVESILKEEIRPYEIGLIPYFRYRSKSEMAVLSEPEWS
jgi:hypothetical protein